MIPRRTSPGLALALVAILGSTACTTRLGGGKASQTAALTRRVTDLEREVQTQTLRAAEAEAKLAAAPASSSEITLATPVLAGIEIDRLSGPTPDDRTGFPVFIRTLDGRGRFLQVVGRLEVEVVVANDDHRAAAVRVANASMGPLELREAYRSGVTGTHYRVDLVAADAFVRSPGYRGELARYDLRIVARLDDLLTGKRHEATGLIRARDRVK